MHARLAKVFDTLWYGGSRWALVLLPVAWVFGAVAGLRRYLYRRNIKKSQPLPVPVIVVGNISAGGTGKTPVVAWLAQQLLELGYVPGIVSRGYGARRNDEPVVVHTGADPELCGDEAVLLAELTGCPVCVCTDRSAAVQRIAREGVNVVVADDGLQHYRMRRDFELVVVDAVRGFGNGFLLPAGPLREPISRLESVDAVLVNGESALIDGIPFRLQQGEAVSLEDGAKRPLSSFAGQKVWSVAGIGNPERFHAQLRAAGIFPDPVPVPDHGRVSLSNLQAGRQQPVLMTSKDEVKYRNVTVSDCWCVTAEAQFAGDQAAGLLQRIRDRIHQPGEGETLGR
ncbi:MAG: tetraacyldisaccharide 4'-kinase [Gammaproteobacteria bacterium]|jgi:tetraacyldisaccharide 4'-kinase|nr:tetraacyldisaccharide 4'-kinase [Gammaproteobacteria bacterium]MDP6615865.1 tetraacyldisaccharide 4'-kinase [Gammaproteobacteria bacterium]MDP6694317.1 tetraacyldisaccharide 4'-kinase [Gammaproteobacteria bacterium]